MILFLQGGSVQRSHQGRLPAYWRRFAEEHSGFEGKSDFGFSHRWRVIGVKSLFAFYFGFCSSWRFTSRGIRSAWWNWSELAGEAGEHTEWGYWSRGDGIVSFSVFFQVESEGGSPLQGLWAAEGLLPASVHLPSEASPPSAALQADPGEAVQALPAHPWGLQGQQRYSWSSLLVFTLFFNVPLKCSHLQPSSCSGRDLWDGAPASGHHDEDGKLPEDLGAEKRSDRHWKPGGAWKGRCSLSPSPLIFLNLLNL